MATKKKATKKRTPAKKKTISEDQLKKFVRQKAEDYLAKPNINSIGIGYKISNGARTNKVCIQFTVDQKAAPEALESLDTEMLPDSIEIDGIEVPTDVLERSYEPKARAINMAARLEDTGKRKSVINPIVPGTSIAHPKKSAGTAGCVVYDAGTGGPLILSNWHVLHGPEGEIGDPVVQPGPHDDNRIEHNIAGRLVRSHLGVAGDCAVATIDQRNLDDEIIDLGIAVDAIGEVKLGDKVVKSGRTTKVTFGIVSRIHVTVEINYGSFLDPHFVNIGCFEIEPDPDKPAERDEISMGGDSGSAWLSMENDLPSTMMVGLHFAGEVGDAREHALACYPASVFEKLAITPKPIEQLSQVEAVRGYDPCFLGGNIFLPRPIGAEVRDDILAVEGQSVFHYTHFSLAMSISRKLARWVAWNIDGAAIKRISRDGIRFRKDPRIPAEAQHGNELYRNNPIDRGHIARRADLVWGPMPEAEQANRDSFFFSNIAPQHEDFNQSRAGGVWGELENAIFESVDVEDLKISVMAGPVFSDQDPPFREARLPRSFWKAIYYREKGQKTIRMRSYVLTQADLLNQLEVLELPEFAVFEMPVNDLQDMIGLDIKNARRPARSGRQAETLEMVSGIRKIDRVEAILA